MSVAHASTVVPISAPAADSARWQIVTAAIGLTVTAMIFLGLGAVQHQRVTAPTEAADDLRAIAIGDEPPPPPQQPDEPTPMLEGATIQLTESRSPDSTFKVPAAPFTTDAPPPAFALPQMHVSLGAPRPGLMSPDTSVQYVYSQSQVDQRPVAIYRVRPHVTTYEVNEMKVPKSSFLMIVGLDGTPSSIHLAGSGGSRDVDAACISALRDWRFKPAIKKGKAVRCWVLEDFVFEVSSGTPFEAH